MKKFRTLAGMAVFALGVLATSSCSKDEFFGLEESEVIDASTKTEIAMSQEYVDFVLACSEMADYITQPMDTTTAEVKIGPDGKRILYKEGPQLSAMALLEVLKEKYPELEKADKMDLDEILKIALSKNKALKGVASKATPKTKYDAWAQSMQWASSHGHGGAAFDEEGWWFYCVLGALDAMSYVFNMASETDEAYIGGLVFDDGSVATMISSPATWPSVANTGYPVPESDFILVFNTDILGASAGDLSYHLGTEYTAGGSAKTHYVMEYEGSDRDGRRYESNWHASSFCY